MRRTLISLATVAAAMLLLAPGALAHQRRIVPGRSIDGASLGQSKYRVRRELGAPSTRRSGDGANGRYTDWYYHRLKLRASFEPDFSGPGVGELETTSRQVQTAKGIHVGSTFRELHRAYPQLHCPSNADIQQSFCYLGGKPDRNGYIDNATVFDSNQFGPHGGNRIVSITIDRYF